MYKNSISGLAAFFIEKEKEMLKPVFRIRRTRKFLGLSDADPLVRGTDPDPSSSSSKPVIKSLISTVL
jgi:hypothetical protein